MAVKDLVSDDPLDALDVGCVPLPKGWYPDGTQGDEGRHEYQAQIVVWANQAQAVYKPIFDKDPNYFYRLANKIGDREGLPRGLMGAILKHESGGKPWVFNVGANRESTAVGLGQIVYTTARGLGRPHTFQATANAEAMADLLKRNLAKADGNLEAALQSYAGNPNTTLYAFYRKYKDTPEFHA